jgi:hypothetical protein
LLNVTLAGFKASLIQLQSVTGIVRIVFGRLQIVIHGCIRILKVLPLGSLFGRARSSRAPNQQECRCDELQKIHTRANPHEKLLWQRLGNASLRKTDEVH